MDKNVKAKARALTSGTTINVYGKCIGLSRKDGIPSEKDFKFPHSIYIEVEDIK